MARILMAGDIHANRHHLEYLFRIAERFQCDSIFSLGDFGFWPRWAGGQQFLKKADDLTEETGITLYWLDGNHEDHDSLDQLMKPDRTKFVKTVVPYRDNGSHKYSTRILYSPRGHRFELDGVTFLTVGGAYSVDKYQRTAHVDWFPSEEISDWDVKASVEGGPVAVVLSHDVPSVSPILEKLLIVKGRSYKLIPEAEHSRAQLERIRSEVNPRLWLHGHYHVDYRHEEDGTLFRGLDCDKTDGFSWTILDTDQFKEGVVP